MTNPTRTEYDAQTGETIQIELTIDEINEMEWVEQIENLGTT